MRDTTTDLLATDGTLVLAIPAFAPAIVVVAVIVWIARRDRRAEAAEAAAEHSRD